MSHKYRGTFAAFLAVASAAAAFAQGRISAVEIVNSPNGLDVVVSGKDLAKPKEIRLLNGASYIAEFDASLDVKGFRKRIEASGITSVEAGWYSARPPKARIHIRLAETMSPTLIESEGKWIIRIVAGTSSAGISNSLPTTTSSGGLDDFPSSVPELNGGGAKPAVKTDPPKETVRPIKEVKTPSVKAQPVKPIGLKPEDLTGSPETNTEVKPIPAKPIDLGPLPPTNNTKIQANNPKPRPDSSERKVNLEFVGADVVQILRALSAEAGVNIVTAPDVSPSDKPSRITVSLRNVSISDALNYVTVMANLRYAKLNNTFFVTKSENFASTMRKFFGGDSSRLETRVVNLVSGDGLQIRNAVLAGYPQDGEGGFYDILDPEGAPSNMPIEGEKGAAADPAKTAAPVAGIPGLMIASPTPNPKDKEPKKVSYLMVVGDPSKLDVVEAAIKSLDSKIASSFSVAKSDDTGAEAVPILSGQTKQIKEMLEKLLAANPRKADFTFSESGLRELSEGDLTTNVLLMIGPKADIQALKQYAQVLDENLCKTAGIAYSSDPTELGRVYEVVDLHYIEPSFASFDLTNRIRGLYVTTLPDPVTPTRMLGTQKDEKRDQTKTPGGENGGQAASETTKKAELEKPLGREPMKLVLRGTRQQIEEAKSYLALVDVAPKQVAFELRVLEMTKEEALRMGLDWNLLTGGRLQNFRFNQGSGDSASSQGTFGGGYNYKAGDVVNFLATLDKADNGRKLIARPNALVTDARPYNLFVGDTIRYIESIQSTQNGVTVQTASIDVGVTLDLLARIGAEGNIAIDVQQRFSLLNGFTSVPGGGQLPQTSERRSQNFVNMKSGEIIVFGGLIQEQDRKRISGIPILKDLPILGPFFSRTDNSKQKTEIVFMLAAVDVTDGNREEAASPGRAKTMTPDPLKEYLKGRKAP